MKTFLTSIIPKIQKFSKKLDDISVFTDKHWVVIDNSSDSKLVYIFRGNNEILISQNGKVSKGKWEFLGNRFLLIDLNEDSSYLFKLDFTDDSILALKIDSKEEYAFLINETKFGIELNSYEKVIEFLTSRYLGFQNTYNLSNNRPQEENIKPVEKWNIQVKVKRTSDGYTAYVPEYSINTGGDTIEEMKRNVLNFLNLNIIGVRAHFAEDELNFIMPEDMSDLPPSNLIREIYKDLLKAGNSKDYLRGYFQSMKDYSKKNKMPKEQLEEINKTLTELNSKRDDPGPSSPPN